MGAGEETVQPATVVTDEAKDFATVTIDDHKLSSSCESNCSLKTDSSLLLCRVCHCAEPDFQGDAALGILGIVPPSQDVRFNEKQQPDDNMSTDIVETKEHVTEKNCIEPPISLEGTVTVDPQIKVDTPSSDIETGLTNHEDSLIYLGCSCKNELALAHYACALKWFINHGSTICEICGSFAQNVRLADFKKVLISLKEHDDLSTRGTTLDISLMHDAAMLNDAVNRYVIPDAFVEQRLQRLSEVSSWFNHRTTPVVISQGQIDQFAAIQSSTTAGNPSAIERANIGRAIETTGVFVAVGMFMVLIAWLIAPHFGKTGALIIFHLLLGGAAALAVILVLRLIIPRLRWGQTRYWGISFIFWFLVLGVWSSRTNSIRLA